jgi:hypothetical protein
MQEPALLTFDSIETICDPPDWGIWCIVTVESHHTTRNNIASTKKQFFVSGDKLA